jgi:hypothetical protein
MANSLSVGTLLAYKKNVRQALKKSERVNRRGYDSDTEITDPEVFNSNLGTHGISCKWL